MATLALQRNKLLEFLARQQVDCVCVKRSTLGAQLYHSLSYCLKQGVSLNLELNRRDWLASKPQRCPCPCLPTAGITCVLLCLVSYVAAAELRSPHLYS